MRAIVLDLVHAVVLKLRPLPPNDVGLASAAESGAMALSVDFGGSVGSAGQPGQREAPDGSGPV